MHGRFHWNELMTRDAEKAKALYTEIAGWSWDPMAMGDDATYWIAKAGDQPAAGIFPMSGPDFDGVPDHWMAYLAVDDVDACITRAKEHGASVKREPFDMPGIGRIAIMVEPGGAMIGWMTPA